MIEGACHCGRLRWRTPETPDWVTQCNCSFCRKTGALWGEVSPRTLELEGREQARTYMFGERSLVFFSCPDCAVTTHWESAKGQPERVKLNFRLAPPGVLDAIARRRFDGADTWRYLD